MAGVNNQDGRPSWPEITIAAALAAYTGYAAARLAFAADVPHVDFFEFRWAAQAWANGDWPASFKRGPLFSLLMALGAMVLPGRDPYLTAGRVLSVTAAPLAILLTWWWGRKALGRWGLAAAAWLPLASVFLVSASSPLCEMAYMTLTLAALAAFERNRWAGYSLAAATSLVRYEAIALIVVLAAVDVVETRAWRRAAPALLLALPAATWLAASYVAPGPHVGYLQQYEALKPAGGAYLLNAASLLFAARAPVLLVLTWAAVALAVVGAVYSLFRRRGSFRAGAAYLLIYTLAHAIWPWDFRRYAVPALALAVVYMFVGGRWLASALVKTRVAGTATAAIALWATAAGVAGLIVQVVSGKGVGAAGVWAPWAFVAAAVVWAAAARWQWRRWAVAALLLALATLHASKSADVMRDDYELEQHGRAYKLAAAYLRVAVPDGRVATSSPWLLSYYWPEGRGRIAAVDGVGAKRYADLAPALRAAGVRYVFADSITCAVTDPRFPPRPAARLLLPLYDGRAGPAYSLVKEFKTPREDARLYRVE